MNTRAAIRNALARIPAPWGAALGLGAFIAASLLLVQVLPPQRDHAAECAKQCAPRFGQLARDMDYPMSAKGQYRQVCKCQ